jgi:ribosome-associated heat shock protein Hsp15
MKQTISKTSSAPALASIRIDKWLWAARFFKTRSLAKQAIDGGKVHCNGEHCKCSREIAAGFELCIRQGEDERTVLVLGLSNLRQGAPQAALLYAETPTSLAKRTQLAAERQAQNAMADPHAGRPTKQDRRLIQRFKRDSLES